MEFLTRDQLVFIFGLIGNVVAILVFLAPLPTFYAVYKKKSSGGYQSIPYVVALISASLLLYYGFLKTNGFFIISINALGCAIESTYLIFYLIYAPKKEKMVTLKMLLMFNIVSFGLTVLLTFLLAKGSTRVTIVGWICAVFSFAVFVAPLSIIRRVIRTRSAEYMPFTLSLTLTINAISWFFYGFFLNDFYIALPNVLGFLFGVAQMILYFMYKDAKKDVDDKLMPQEVVVDLKEFTTENKSCPSDNQ